MNDSPYRVEPTNFSGKGPENRKHRSFGRWLRFAGMLGVVVLVLQLLLPLPFRRSTGATWKTQSRNQLKQIMVAMECYRDDHGGALPPAFTVDERGRRLHSWRTLLLPHLYHESHYRQIDLTVPWDHPDNLAVARSINVFGGYPRDLPDGMTLFHAVDAGRENWFEKASLDHSPEKAILLVQVNPERAVHWMCPEDAASELLFDPHSFRLLPFDGQVQAICRDGRVISCEADELTARPVPPEEID